MNDEIKDMLKSILEGQQILKAEMDKRFNSMDQRFESLEAEIKAIHEKVNQTEGQITKMEDHLSKEIKDVDQSINYLAGKLGMHEKDIHLLKERVR